MDNKYLAKVEAFATSANIGPGFDRAGLAINISNKYRVLDYAENYCFLRGNEKIAANNSSLLIKTIKYAKSLLSIEDKKGLIIEKEENIPTGRGLGSSAADIIAGILLVNHIYNLKLKKREIFEIALEIEKHPDNIAASLEGGFVICFKNDGGFLYRRIRISPDIRVLLLIPKKRVITTEARKVLPQAIPIQDAIENTSHFGLMVDALKEGNFKDMGIFIKDYIHQNYRKGIYPKSLQIIDKLINKYNIPAAISGSGSTVIALAEKGFKIDEKFAGYKLLCTEINDTGSYCV